MKKLFKKKSSIILILFYIVTIYLMYAFPLLHDDLLHGSLGIGYNFMPHVNGRYLGNFFGVLLSSNLILRVVIKSVVIILIILMSKKLLKIKDNSYLLIFLVLFLFMPKEMFRETFPFTSGFANYVIPIAGILFIMAAHINNWFFRKTNFWIIPIFLLGIFSSLFVEHITLYNLFFSIYLLIFSYIKNKKLNIFYLSYFIGSLGGTILMFINPNYLISLNGEDAYRSIASFKEIFVKPWAILRAAFFHNYAINFSLILLTIFLYKNIVNKKKLVNKIVISFILFFGFYTLTKIFNQELFMFLKYIKHFEAFISFIFFICIGYLIYISKLLKKSEMYRFILYIASIIAILTPLVFVSPLGPRCYIITYIIMIIFVTDLFMIMEKNKLINVELLSNFLILLIIIKLSFYLFIYSTIHTENITRVKLVKEQVAQEIEYIEINNFTYSNFLHMPDMCSEYSQTVFREYYKIPAYTSIRVSCE